MHQVDEVKRALVRGAVAAMAARLQLPEELCMSLTEKCGWNVAAAEAVVDAAIQQVAADVAKDLEAQLFTGGGAGGGKSERLDSMFTRGHHAETYRAHLRFQSIVQRNNGVIVSCAS